MATHFLLALVALTAALFPSGRAQSAPAPFDSSYFSEQIVFNAASPQFVGPTTNDTLTFTSQYHEGSNPTGTKLFHYTRGAQGYVKAWERDLPLPRLIGMTSDGRNFYVVTAAHENLSNDTTTLGFRPNVLIMTMFDNRGNQIWQRDINNADYLGGNAKSAVFSPLAAGSGTVVFGAGKIVIALASNTLPDTHGLRHQRAQYFVVNSDGTGMGASSETSWRHSFDQRLVFDGRDFVFMDLADAGWYMPGAGITLRKIRSTANVAEFIGDQENKQGTYIYARQGESTGNQNFSFTSLGDLEVGAQGYATVFTSEKNNPGVERDGWSVPIAEPRNVGFVHVTRAFETVREGSWNSRPTLGNTIIQNSDPLKINISRNVVDSNGASNTFARPGNPNKTFTQTGVVWLTNLPAGMSAERPKMIKLANDHFVTLWEEWSYQVGSEVEPSYSATKAMIINELGAIIAGPVSLNARLNPSGADRLFILDGKAAWITGSAATQKFVVNSVDVNLSFLSTTLDSETTPPVAPHNQLIAGERLRPNEYLQSSNGLFKLVYQTDGNLVLYSNGRALWQSYTSGRPAGSANMQSDGNFAIYGPDGSFQWNTGTTIPGSKLVLIDDGRLVIVSADGNLRWSSEPAAVRDRLNAGDKLRPGDKLESSNGRYQLIYQTDGNLVLYSNGRALWQSYTSGRPAGSANMQSDGNFAIYGPDGSFQWNTGTTIANSFIVLQSDGNLVIYNNNNRAIWASNTAH